jgi:hypothetical protein
MFSKFQIKKIQALFARMEGFVDLAMSDHLYGRRPHARLDQNYGQLISPPLPPLSQLHDNGS